MGLSPSVQHRGLRLRTARAARLERPAGEVGRTLSIDDFDIERIFGQEGVGILHLSGLIAAMSHETTECCLALAKAAKQYGTLVSFDLNYRATFWKGREEELSKAFSEIAPLADVLIGNEEDFQLCLGFRDRTGGKDLGFQNRVLQSHDHAGAGKISERENVRNDAASGHFGQRAPLGRDFAGGWEVVRGRAREIQVMDRIGGGDGFPGASLWRAEWLGSGKRLQFGWATGVLAASSLNDYAEPADEKQVWDIYKGNARVQR